MCGVKFYINHPFKSSVKYCPDCKKIVLKMFRYFQRKRYRNKHKK